MREATLPQLSAGDVFDGYRIVRTNIGKGASGVVHEATDAQGRRCALKILRCDHPHSTHAVERFKEEFRLLIGLSHPHVAAGCGFGCVDGFYSIATEFIDGTKLADFTRGKAASEMLPLFVQMLEGIDFIHRHGMLHLDIKSENVLVQHTPQGPQVKIIDFSVAGISGNIRAVAGSVPYMAPELITGDIAHVDQRADLFSCAVLMYVCCTWGRFPFPRTAHRNLSILRRLVATETLRGLPSAVYENSDEALALLDKILPRLLKQNPDERFYANARAVIGALSPHNIQDREKSAGYLHPARQVHIGNRSLQHTLLREITAFKDGNTPDAFAHVIVGDAGMGKTHLLSCMEYATAQYVDRIVVWHFSAHIPSDVADWLQNPDRPAILLIDDCDQQEPQQMEFANGLFLHLEDRLRHPEIWKNMPSLMVVATATNRQFLHGHVRALGCAHLVKHLRQHELAPLSENDIIQWLKCSPAFFGRSVPQRLAHHLSEKSCGHPETLVALLKEPDEMTLTFTPDGSAIVTADASLAKSDSSEERERLHPRTAAQAARMAKDALQRSGMAEHALDLCQRGIDLLADTLSSQKKKLHVLINGYAIEALMALGKPARAEKYLEAALSTSESMSSASWTWRAWLALRACPALTALRRWDEARMLVRDLLESSPWKDTPLHIALMNCEAQIIMRAPKSSAHHLADAESIYRGTLAVQRRLPQANRQRVANNDLGLALYRLGRYREAVDAIAEKTSLLVSTAPLTNRLMDACLHADALRLSGDPTQALRHMRMTMKHLGTSCPPSVSMYAHEVLANILHDLNDFPAAIGEATACMALSAIADRPESHQRHLRQLWGKLGHCYKELQQWDRAQMFFEAMLHDSPEPLEALSAHVGCAETLWHQAHYDKSAEHMESAQACAQMLPTEVTRSYLVRIRQLEALLATTPASAATRAPQG